MNTSTREQHLDWCKARANEYIEHGDIRNGLALMASDLSKHPATENHPLRMKVAMLMVSGKLSTVQEARDFINGFN